MGNSVAVVGDIDGDGSDDFLVGAPGETAHRRQGSGRAYLIDGKEGEVLKSFFSPGPSTEGSFGYSVAPAGDIDGDGTTDVLIGAPQENAQGEDSAGRAYVFSGADGDVLEALVSPSPRANGSFGTSVAGVKDVDGDGTADLLVGASSEWVGDKGGAGRAYLFSGETGELLKKLESPNPESRGSFGLSVASIGDFNADDAGDFLIGAPFETVAAQSRAGRAYLFSGKDGRVSASFASPNPTANGSYGASVAYIGDIDGRPRFVIGAPYETAGDVRQAGRAYVINGRDGWVEAALSGPDPEEGGQFGISVASVGDADGDEIPDLVVGAKHQTSEGIGEAGQVHLFSGKNGDHLTAISSANPEQGGDFGISVSGGDLHAEKKSAGILVGAYEEAVEGTEGAGRSYVYEVSESSFVAAEIDTDVPQTQMERPNAVAVVIGIQRYKHQDIPDVDYALRDAWVMKKYLVQTMGFREENVIFAANASGSALERIFGTASDAKGQLYNWVEPNKSEVFVYYSGHGAPNPDSETTYLVPGNGDPNYLAQTGYPVEQLYENLAQVPAKSTTVVLEACFSGISEAGPIIQRASPVELSVENPVLGIDGGLAVTAGAADQIASWYAEKKHGLFTYYFLKGLRGTANQNHDEVITGVEMGRYLTEKVPYQARRLYNREQVPQVVGRDKDQVLVRYE